MSKYRSGRGRKLTFGFDKVREGIQDLLQVALIELRTVQATVLHHESKLVKDWIEAQRFDHAPLSEGYEAHKAATGLDTRILIATRFYLDSIGHYIDPRDPSVQYVGVPDAIHEPSGVDLKILADWLEYGTVSMPARPHYLIVHRHVMKTLPLQLMRAGFSVRRLRGRV